VARRGGIDAGRRRERRAAGAVASARAAAAVAVVAAAAFVAGAAGAAAGPADGGWVLALADTVRVAGGTVRLADVTTEPVPADLADLVLLGNGLPGTAQTLERRLVLRRLVELGRAGDVRRCAGAEACRIHFTGDRLPLRDLEGRIAALLGPWLPAPDGGSPPPWLEVEAPAPRAFGPAAAVELVEPKPLRPGRNLVAVRLSEGERATRLAAPVVCHSYGETASARSAVAAGTPLSPDLFLWSWTDLAGGAPGLAVGREALAGRSAGRALTAGEALRAADLRITPLVRSGEPVELDVARGAVVVTVRAVARQDGALDQVITVRNEYNGQLVTARVVGAGRVRMGR